MAFDGIVLKSITNELQNIINYKIDKVYQPDKNTILLGLYGKGTNFTLLACISANNARVHLTSHHQKNPTSAPNFCMLLRKHLIGLKIKKIYTVDLERIMFIDLKNSENPNKPIYKRLIIELMGKHSNIILTDKNDIIIDSLRHTTIETHSNRDIYPTSRYIFPEATKYSFLELKDFNDFYAKIESKFTKSNADSNNNLKIDKIISDTFNGISSSFIQKIIKELNLINISKQNLQILYNKINEILSSPSEFRFSEDGKDYYLFPIPNKKTKNNFDLNFSIDEFYFCKENTELFKNYKNSILNFILMILKKYEKRLENIDNKLSECKDMNKYKLYGELITSNLYKIPNKNINSIDVENYYNNNELITIPLDEKYLPSYNAKRYFKKYSKLKSALEVVNIQKIETIKDIDYIESVIYEIESCKTLEDIEEVYNEISENSIFADKSNLQKSKSKKKRNFTKAKQLTKNKLVSFNPLKYIIDGYTILVGRNNKENDYLTCKFASKNDIWFHTKDIHGSHVILKVSSNENIPEEILLEAAKLAVKHSKAKNSSHVPVDFCRVSFVKKPSGSKPGYVTYTNNKTLIV